MYLIQMLRNVISFFFQDSGPRMDNMDFSDHLSTTFEE